MNDKQYSAAQVAAVALQTRNMVLGLILAFFFGSIGLFYTSITLGIIGLIVELIIWGITLLTFGLGGILVVPWHIFSMIVVAVMINSRNKRVLASFK